MICHFARIIALLCLEPSRGAFSNYMRIPEAAVGHNPLVRSNRLWDVNSMNMEASREIYKSYSRSPKRLILLDDFGTIKPTMSENNAEDHWRIMQALEKLSADQRNEVWIISDGDVRWLQDTYGHINGLHFAGYKGTQLGVNSPRGIILPQRSSAFVKLGDQADDVVKGLGISPQFVSRHDYFIEYIFPLGPENANWAKVTEMKQTLEAVIASNPSFQVGKVETYQTPTDCRLVLEDRERYHKGTLAEALFRKEEQMNWPFTFGLSISDMPMDEPMHLAMRARGHHAIVVKNPYEIDHVPWLTYASHRFHNYRESIDLLEELAEPRNLNNGFWHRVLQSIRGIGQEIRLLLKKLTDRYSRIFDF